MNIFEKSKLDKWDLIEVKAEPPELYPQDYCFGLEWICAECAIKHGRYDGSSS